MALATTDADGLPDVRIVLLKDADERGFVFYTNTLSMKGWSSRTIRAPPWCCIGRACAVRSGPAGP